jgi:hypothetical protein
VLQHVLSTFLLSSRRERILLFVNISDMSRSRVINERVRSAGLHPPLPSEELPHRSSSSRFSVRDHRHHLSADQTSHEDIFRAVASILSGDPESIAHPHSPSVYDDSRFDHPVIDQFADHPFLYSELQRPLLDTAQRSSLLDQHLFEQALSYASDPSYIPDNPDRPPGALLSANTLANSRHSSMYRPRQPSVRSRSASGHRGGTQVDPDDDRDEIHESEYTENQYRHDGQDDEERQTEYYGTDGGVSMGTPSGISLERMTKATMASRWGAPGTM